jgi:hypothetical protein
MLEGLTPPVEDALCKVGRISSDLSPEDNQILTDALADPKWSTNGLALALRGRGLDVGDTVLRKHRKKECACARAA